MNESQYDTCTRREGNKCQAFKEFECLKGECRAFTTDRFWKVRFYQEASAAGYPVQLLSPKGRDETVEKSKLEIAREKINKDEYLRLTAEGKNDKQIYEEKGIEKIVFYTIKREWGLKRSSEFDLELSEMTAQVEPKTPAPVYKHEGTLEAVTTLNNIISAITELDGLMDSVQSTVVSSMLTGYHQSLINAVKGLADTGCFIRTHTGVEISS